MITIHTSNAISLDGKPTGLYVRQDEKGTVVYANGPVWKLGIHSQYREFDLPYSRYSLSSTAPTANAQGGLEAFERHLRELIAQLSGPQEPKRAPLPPTTHEKRLAEALTRLLGCPDLNTDSLELESCTAIIEGLKALQQYDSRTL